MLSDDEVQGASIDVEDCVVDVSQCTNIAGPPWLSQLHL